MVKNVAWRQRITNDVLCAGLSITNDVLCAGLSITNDVFCAGLSITNDVLCAGLSRIPTTIRERHLRFSGHCRKSKNEDRSVEGQARTFVDLLKADTGVPRDYLQTVMYDRVGWRKRVIRR